MFFFKPEASAETASGSRWVECGLALLVDFDREVSRSSLDTDLGEYADDSIFASGTWVTLTL